MSFKSEMVIEQGYVKFVVAYVQCLLDILQKCRRPSLDRPQRIYVTLPIPLSVSEVLPIGRTTSDALPIIVIFCQLVKIAQGDLGMT